MKHLLLASVALATLSSAHAEVRSYALDPDLSTVTFTYVLSGVAGTGTMPITIADLRIDFANITRSDAFVELDVSGAKTGAGFVTQALKGPQVLAAATFPKVQFQSTSVTGSIRDGAKIAGDVTVRGVTQPITLDAQIFRRADSAAGDLSRLTVYLKGAIDRSDFGADGFAEFVADRVELDIRALISEE